MIGATLSRWTMSYFALALVSLVGALCLLAWSVSEVLTGWAGVGAA